MGVAAKLAQYRTSAGMTQKQVAALLQLSLTTLFKWENGHTYPNAHDLERLAELYEIHPGIFFDAPRSGLSMDIPDEIITLARLYDLEPVEFIMIKGDLSLVDEAGRFTRLRRAFKKLSVHEQNHLIDIAQGYPSVSRAPPIDPAE